MYRVLTVEYLALVVDDSLGHVTDVESVVLLNSNDYKNIENMNISLSFFDQFYFIALERKFQMHL